MTASDAGEWDIFMDEIERLRLALEFYADPHGWKLAQPDEDESIHNIHIPEFYDELNFGAKAKSALALNLPQRDNG